ncbi:predicted protein, partial [Nematostella vectensis]
MIVFALFAAFFTRVLFSVHVLLSVGLVVLHTKQPLYWAFLLGLVALVCEMLYVMIVRKGAEYKYFWPSCFLYISAIIPVVWVMELDLLRHRLDKRDQLTLRLSGSNTIDTSGLNIDGIGIAATIQVDTAAKKVCELGVVVIIIVGRWLLPRGRMTRDQLSNLLLCYIGMGADILELFAALTEPEVMHNASVTYATLALFSWSMFQFCVVATATVGGSEESPDITHQPSEVSTSIVDFKKKKHLAALFMQDGPFLLLRLSLLIGYGVSSEIHIFFTAKNALTVVIMLYRLYIL